MARLARGAPNAQRAKAAERRTRAIDLDLAGVDKVTIAKQLDYGKKDADGTLVTSDRDLRDLVSKDIKRGLEDRRDVLQASAEVMVAQMTDRYSRLLAACWAEALKGSPAHIREARAILANLSRLHGLDKPIRHEVEIPGAGAALEQAVAELLSLAGPGGESAVLRALPGG